MDVDIRSRVNESPGTTPEPLNKRYRQKFSADDKELFVRILKEHMHVIERKEGDVLTLKRKHAAWRNVLKAYNEGASSERDLHQLRLLWKRMKKGSSAQQVLKEELQATPEEFTVMVDPFEIKCEPSVNHTDNLKSSMPTPSPDSSDCLDLIMNDDCADRPLHIVLDVEKSEKLKTVSPKHCTKGVQFPENGDLFQQITENAKCQISAYEQCLLDMAEQEHAQKMAVLKRRKQNEALREELLRLKIKTQLLKQEQCQSQLEGVLKNGHLRVT